MDKFSRATGATGAAGIGSVLRVVCVGTIILRESDGRRKTCPGLKVYGACIRFSRATSELFTPNRRETV